MISALRFLNGKAVRDQFTDIDASCSNQIEKGFYVSLLGPTHISERVVMASLFIFRIVTTWTVRHRDRELQLTRVEWLPGNIQTSQADNHHTSFWTRDSSRQLHRLIGFSRRSYQHGVSTTSTSPVGYCFRRFLIGNRSIIRPQLERECYSRRIQIETKNTATIRFQKLHC